MSDEQMENVNLVVGDNFLDGIFIENESASGAHVLDMNMNTHTLAENG